MGSLQAAVGVCALLLGAPDSDEYPISSRRIEIPVGYNASERHRIRELRLFVSRDRGKTWQLSGRITPDQTSFVFRAPEDGLFWFSVLVVEKDGSTDPPRETDLQPGLKVRVEPASQPSYVKTASASEPGSGPMASRVRELEQRVKELEVGTIQSLLGQMESRLPNLRPGERSEQILTLRRWISEAKWRETAGARDGTPQRMPRIED